MPDSFIRTLRSSGVIDYTWTCYIADDFSPSIRAYCSANYTPPVVPRPACNSLTASPTSGTSPLTSTLSCATTDATTVSISCGNGTSISGANGTCTYSTVGSYTPVCTVNGNTTSSACTANISVNTPTPTGFDLSIKKYFNFSDDANSAP